MNRSTFALSLALVIACGCTESFDCRTSPTEPACGDYLDGARFVDTGPPDAGDAAMPDAHVPCNGACTGATSACLVSGGTESCVGCVGNGDCSGATSRCETTSHTCVACLGDGDCSGATHRCETTSHACVACLASADCTSPTAAACNTTTHACGACTTNADCAHLTGTGVCDAGTCVQCSATDESACGTNVCDVGAHTCSTVPAGSVGYCRNCTSDRACMVGTACVMQRFDEPPVDGVLVDVGYVCLPTGTACPTSGAPFVSPAMETTHAGVPTAVCDMRAATCAAYLQYDAADCTVDTGCGAPSIDDAVCRMRSGVGLRCTTRCLSSDDCNVGAGCSTGAPPHYCCFGASCM